MGCYVQTRDNEAWLEEHGVELPDPPKSVAEHGADTLPVVLVDNGPFKAAAIAFDNRELVRFRYPDPRPKRWFIVSIADLKQVSWLTQYLEEGLTS